MRKIILLAIFCAATNVMAQTFEGSIKWSITTDVSDPAMKSQMQQAQKQMNDPATQQKMKELQKQMEDPQFKAMMDANPKMKEQMEQALKMMENTDFSSMMPTGMLVKIKGKKSLTKVEGGITGDMEMLNTGDGKNYTINRKEKTYQMEEIGDEGYDFEDSETTVTKTSETKKILGYTCTKYILKSEENGQTLEQYIWATNEIKDLNFTDFLDQRKEAKGQMMVDFKKIDGVPLRMEMGAQGVKMIMEATEVKRGGVSNADFEIPAGFKKVSGY